MDKILLKPMRSEVHYQGPFADLAFGLLANPIPLYQNLLKHLGKYGATLNTLKYDATVLSDANVNCSLLELSTIIRVRLDRLEVTFLKLYEVGEEIANQILLDSWAAVHETEASVVVVEHGVMINVYTQILDASYDTVIRRYVTTPPTLGEKTHAGVVFYLPEDSAKGEKQGSVVLDRLTGQEQHLVLKVSAAFDAKQVPFNTLDQRIDEYVTRHLDYLGLALERENGR